MSDSYYRYSGNYSNSFGGASSFVTDKQGQKERSTDPRKSELNEIVEEDPNFTGGEIKPFRFNCKKFMSFIGPGFLMSIAYLDPGNIAGDLSAGVQGKYALIWTLMWATILGLYYQAMAARIGVVT